MSAAQRERAARVKREEVPLGWGVLQKRLLKDLIAVSKSASGSLHSLALLYAYLSICLSVYLSLYLCIRACLFVSDRVPDPNTTAGYITYLLRNYRELLSPKYQGKLAAALSLVTDDLPMSLRTQSYWLACRI